MAKREKSWRGWWWFSDMRTIWDMCQSVACEEAVHNSQAGFEGSKSANIFGRR